MATITIMLLFASTMLAVVPMAKALETGELGLSKTSGFVGDKIVVTGKAEFAGSTIAIFFDGEPAITGFSKSDNSFAIEIEIPEIAAGTYNIEVQEFKSGETITLPSDVVTFTVEPQIVVSLDDATGIVTVIGTGFEAEETVEINFDGAHRDTIETGPETDVNGSFTVTFDLPDDLLTDDYLVEATVGSSSADTLLEFTAAPKIVLTPDTGFPDVPISIEGTDFTDGDIITIEFDGEVVVEAFTVTGTGFTETFKVPLGLASGGAKTVVALNEDGDEVASTTFTLTLEASIDLSAAEGLPGDVITVTGKNFGAETTVTIVFNGATVKEDVEVTDLGTFETTFTVPTGTGYNTYTNGVVATDDALTPNEAKATLKIGAIITLTVYGEPIHDNQMPSGSTITVNGRGFTPNAPAQISFCALPGAPDAIPVDTHVSVNSDGTFTANVIVPSLPKEDTYTVFAMDSLSISASTDLDVNQITKITLDPVVAIRGVTEVTVSGESFAMNFTDTKVTFVIGTRSLDNLDAVEVVGSFEYVIIVPADMPAGTYDFIAYDTKGLTATAEIVVVIAPVVLADPSEVVTGQTVNVTGYAFNVYGTGYNATVTISGNGIEPIVVTNVTHTDLINGDVEILITTIPVGTYTVTVETDDDIPVVGSTTIDVIASTTVTVDPKTTLRDSDITINGEYFTAEAGVKVTITIYDEDDNEIDILVGELDENGSFSEVWSVPEDLELGVYTAVAIDDNGLTGEDTFEVVALTLNIETADFYWQGNTGYFKISANAKTEGNITVVLPDGAYITLSTTQNGVWKQNKVSGLWEYYESSNAMSQGISFYIPNDAVNTNTTKLPYVWEAEFKDAAFVVNVDGEFDVYTSFVDSPGTSNSGSGGTGPAGPQGEPGKDGAAGAAGAAGSAGARGSNGSNGANGAKGEDGAKGEQGQAGPAGSDAPTTVANTSNAALIIAVVALIVGAIAAFIVITMRRKIAN